MTAIEKVGLLDSNNTLLNSDYDFSAFELRLTDNTGGVLFDDVDVKTEFNLSGTSGDVTISAGNAIIVATRATSTPIPNKKIAVRYQLSDTKTLAGIGTKIYIELDQTLIDDPTLIEDTYPSIDYAQGKNIGELKRADERPTNPHIKLWEYDGAWNDLRTYPEIDGKKIDSNVVKLTGNQTIAGIKTFTSSPIVPKATQSNEAPNLGQVESVIIEATGATDLVDGTFMLGEPCIKGDSLFKEVGPIFAEATTEQNIGDVAGNTRVSIPVIGSGVAGNSLKLALAKVVSPSVDFNIRIETDNAGEPSGTLVDANATATIAPGDLTTDLANTAIIFGEKIDNEHLVTLDNNELTQTTYKGVKFTLTQQVGMVSVDKVAGCTATKAYLYNEAGDLLDTKTFSINTATFNNLDLVNGESYYILCGSDGGSYTSVKQTGSASFPYNEDKIDFVSGVARVETSDISTNNSEIPDGGTGILTVPITPNKDVFLMSYSNNVIGSNVVLRLGSDILETGTLGVFSGNTLLKSGLTYTLTYTKISGYSLSTSQTSSSSTNVLIGGAHWSLNTGFSWYVKNTVIKTEAIVLSSVNINNITQIKTNDNILIPKGDVAHVVLFQGTYGSETVNATNYYKIGYDVKNTTTRPFNVFDGTDWGTADNDKFGYVDSNLFTDTLLSKTDATYSYKLPTDIPRFAKTNGAIGEKVKCSFKGIADLFTGLTTGRFYYAGNTNGTISINPGTNTSVLGYSVSNTKLDVGYRDLIFQGTTYSVASLPTNRSTSSTTYITLKSATIRQDGIYQIDFRLMHSHSLGIVYAQVFRNGVAYGIEHSAPGGEGAIPQTENLYFNANDLLEVRLRTPSNIGNIRDLTIRHGIYQKNTDTTAINTVD